eukprot:g64968.t1
MPRMLDTESDTDHEVGVGSRCTGFSFPCNVGDVDGLAPDLVSLATTQVGNIDDYDEFRRPRDPVSPATTVVYVVPDPLPCIRCGLRLEYLLYHELAHENYRERPCRDLVPIIICYVMCEPLMLP